MFEMTGWRAVQATRSQWRRDPKNSDRRICPVCGLSVFWPNYARGAHMRVHVKAGWTPPREEPPLRNDRLIFRGVEIEVPGEVVRNAYHPLGLDIDVPHPHPHTHGRFASGHPSGVVIHDTVTASARSGFWALLDRVNDSGQDTTLGTAIIVGAGGIIYQIVRDLDRVTWHASGWSDYKIGVDMACLVDPRLAPNSPLRRLRTSWSEARGYIDYTEAQKDALRTLVKTLCGALDVPFDCPREADGRPATRGYGKGPVRSLVKQGPRYRGVVAHAQISKVRWDGNRALEVLFGR